MPISRRTLLGVTAMVTGAAATGAVARTAACGLSALGQSPSGKRLERIAASPHFRNGAFHNLEPVVDLMDRDDGWRKLLAFMFEDDSQQKPTAAVASVKTDLTTLSDGQMVWFGHSGFFLRMAGKNFLIDPALTASFPVSGFFMPFAGADIYQPEDIPHIDYLILTHDHYDHLDMHTVVHIASRTDRVICPLGVGAHLEYWGWEPEKITELDWNERAALDAQSRITCLPSQHFSGRSIKRNQTLWCGYMIEIDHTVLYFSGDGGYGKHFAHIAEMWPRIDLAIVENGQYNTDWASIHLMPAAWRQAVADLRCAAVMGCHNSKFDLSRHSWIEPMQQARLSAHALKVPLVSPIIGQIIRFDRLGDYDRVWWPESA